MEVNVDTTDGADGASEGATSTTGEAETSSSGSDEGEATSTGMASTDQGDTTTSGGSDTSTSEAGETFSDECYTEAGYSGHQGCAEDCTCFGVLSCVYGEDDIEYASCGHACDSIDECPLPPEGTAVCVGGSCFIACDMDGCPEDMTCLGGRCMFPSHGL